MPEFDGFQKETVLFFEELKKNNTRQWFEESKQDYEDYVKQPSIDFVLAMGDRLRTIAPGINAVPKVNQSLFRLNRDTRFSKDKSPYKTNLGIWFWDGRGKRMESSGFYFHLEDDRLVLGCGLYIFTKELLERYREAVVDEKHGPGLRKAVEAVSKRGYYVRGSHYKRVPRGYDPSHKNAEFLLYNGLHAGIETKIPREFYSKALIEYSLTHFKGMRPLHEWLNEAVVLQ